MKYKFIGYNTQRNIKYETEGNSYHDIFNYLLDINVTDTDKLYDYVSDKLGIKRLADTETEEEFEKINAQIEEGMLSLTDDEYRTITESCDGNAYYQTWYNEEGKQI